MSQSANQNRWTSGHGVIVHTQETCERIAALADRLALNGDSGDGIDFYDLLRALDRVCSAAMWLVVHQT